MAERESIYGGVFVSNISLSDFKQNETVFVVYMKKGYNTDPIIIKRNVTKVGRKYVTLDSGARFSGSPYKMSFPVFIEDVPYGEKGYLFKTQKDAEEWIEMDRLELWLRNLNVYNHPYTLEQLRKVKEILTKE